MENYILPKICDHGGELSARWFVEYKFKHPETNKFVKFREWISTKLLTRSARYIRANEIKNKLSLKLKSGFNPFEQSTLNKNLIVAINEVLEIKKHTTTNRTYKTYLSTSGIFITWLNKNALNTLFANEWNKQKTQLFLDYLITQKKYSNRTHNNILIAMRTIFNTMYERELVQINPFKMCKKLPIKQTALSFFNSNERQLIKQNLPHDHYELFCISQLIYYCFLRPAEIVRLQIKEIDFINMQIIIPGNKSKNGKTQIVVLPNDLMETLQKLNLSNYPNDYYVFATTKKLKPNIKPMAPTRIADAWRWFVKEKYNISTNIYDFKPTGVAAALKSGINARDIQLQIRHSSLDQTQIYLDKISNHAGQVFRDKMQAF